MDKTALEVFGVHRARCAAGPGAPWREGDATVCDCGFAAAMLGIRERLADFEAQTRESARALADGWTPIDTREELSARYGDRTLADRLPRAFLYLDIGYLVAALEAERLNRRVS